MAGCSLNRGEPANGKRPSMLPVTSHTCSTSFTACVDAFVRQRYTEWLPNGAIHEARRDEFNGTVGNAGCDDVPRNGVSGVVRCSSLYRHCIFNEPGMASLPGHCTPIAFSMTLPSRWGLSALSRRPRSGRGQAALDRYPCCTAVSAVLAKPRFWRGSRRPQKIQVPLEFQGLAPRLATAPSLRI
jgi:hypothetical protein